MIFAFRKSCVHLDTQILGDTGLIPMPNFFRMLVTTATNPNYHFLVRLSVGVAEGSFSGIRATSISCKRLFLLEKMRLTEKLFAVINDRIKLIQQKLVFKRELYLELYNSITSDECFPDIDVARKCSENSTSVPLQLALTLKKFQEQCIDVLSHPFTDYSCDPLDSAIANSSFAHLWSFVVMFAISCSSPLSLMNSIQLNNFVADIFISCYAMTEDRLI